MPILLRRLLMLALVAAPVVLLYVLLKPSTETSSGQRLELPWDIETFDDGTAQVFGLRLDTTQAGEAIAQLGEDHDLAIMSTTDTLGEIEIYYGYFRSGPLQGKLILGLGASENQIADFKERSANLSHTSSGNRKYVPAADDLPEIFSLPISSVSFIPAARLDAEIINARFGAPAEIIEVSETETHYLFPNRGLDITVNSEGKDVLQYVAPRAFQRLRQPLERLTETSTSSTTE